MKKFYMKFRVGLLTFTFGLAAFWFINGLINGLVEKQVDLPKVSSETPLFVFPIENKEIGPLGSAGGGNSEDDRFQMPEGFPPLKRGDFSLFAHACGNGSSTVYFDWEKEPASENSVGFKTKSETKNAFEEAQVEAIEILSPLKVKRNIDGEKVKSITIVAKNNEEYSQRTGKLTHIEKIEYGGKLYYSYFTAPTKEKLKAFERYLKRERKNN